MYKYDWNEIFAELRESAREDFEQSIRNPLFWMLLMMLIYLVWDIFIEHQHGSIFR